jgi:cell division protein FtsB
MEPNKKSPIEKASDFVLHFRDVRAVGLVLFLIIVLLVSWSGVKVIDTNYRLQKDISRLEQQNQIRRLTNANIKLQNEYYQTNQYLEIAARQDFGLAAPGETALNVPSQVALAHTVDLPDSEQEQVRRAKAKQPAYQRNFQAWINFLLNRQTLQE